MTPAESTLRAQAAVQQSWGRTTDRPARTAAARAAFEKQFLTAADGDPVRAAHLRKAHFARLQFMSIQSRRKAKEAALAAKLAEAELAAMGGGHVA